MHQPVLGGTVTPPKNMEEAARKTLGDRYAEFKKIYPDTFTPKQLVDFHEAK